MYAPASYKYLVTCSDVSVKFVFWFANSNDNPLSLMLDETTHDDFIQWNIFRVREIHRTSVLGDQDVKVASGYWMWHKSKCIIQWGIFPLHVILSW